MKKSTFLSAALVAIFTIGLSVSGNAQSRSKGDKIKMKPTEVKKEQTAKPGLTQEKVDHAEDKSRGNAFSGNNEQAKPTENKGRNKARGPVKKAQAPEKKEAVRSRGN